jgi:hypothetical protein
MHTVNYCRVSQTALQQAITTLGFAEQVEGATVVL